MESEILARQRAKEEQARELSRGYDQAFIFLKQAAQPGLSNEAKAGLTIRGCFGFLKAYDMEGNEKSKDLILTKVCGFLDDVNRLYRRVGVFPMPNAQTREEKLSGLYLLRLGTFYYSQGIEAETDARQRPELSREFNFLAIFLYRRAVFAYLDSFKSFNSSREADARAQMAPSLPAYEYLPL
jgi:hypothetical protein